MMGYAQIHGSFVLDASLINQAPFDEVKRKGAVGGQGGGVIGVESHKRDSGLLRSFGWGNIGGIARRITWRWRTQQYQRHERYR